MRSETADYHRISAIPVHMLAESHEGTLSKESTTDSHSSGSFSRNVSNSKEGDDNAEPTITQPKFEPVAIRKAEIERAVESMQVSSQPSALT